MATITDSEGNEYKLVEHTTVEQDRYGEWYTRHSGVYGLEPVGIKQRTVVTSTPDSTGLQTETLPW